MNALILNEQAKVKQSTTEFTNEFLSFSLGNQEFCLDILNVQEIRGYDAITEIANTPNHILGVINLRDKIVPIIDLRIKLNFEKISYDDLTVVIILSLNDSNFGIVVDGVSDVIELKSDQIKDLPDILAGIDTEYITGIATVNSQTMLMLDTNKLINLNDHLGEFYSEVLQ